MLLPLLKVMRTTAPTLQCCGGFVGNVLGIAAAIWLRGISPGFGWAEAVGGRGPSGKGAA